MFEEEEEALKANEDVDPIIDDEESTHETNGNHDIAGEDAGRPDILVAEASPVDDHGQDMG